eukprot:4884035-Amphidinium_carterae.1
MLQQVSHGTLKSVSWSKPYEMWCIDPCACCIGPFLKRASHGYFLELIQVARSCCREFNHRLSLVLNIDDVSHSSPHRVPRCQLSSSSMLARAGKPVDIGHRFYDLVHGVELWECIVSRSAEDSKRYGQVLWLLEHELTCFTAESKRRISSIPRWGS